MKTEYTTLAQIVEQLEKCEYECEGGYLKNNVAFVALKNKASDLKAMCCLGKEHPCPMNVNDGCCAADSCQYKVRAV